MFLNRSIKLFDLTKIDCSVHLIVKSYIIEMCKIKYFICDPVSVTKKLRPFQENIKYKYILELNQMNKNIKYLV